MGRLKWLTQWFNTPWKTKALCCQWTKIEKLEFNQCVAKCCSGCNTLQNFSLHLILEPPLGFYLMFTSTWAHLWARVEYLHPPHWNFQRTSFCMLVTMSHLQPCSNHAQGRNCCAHAVFTMQTSIALTHGVVCIVMKPSSQSLNDLSQVSCLSLTSSVNHTEYMLSWWFEASCCQFMLTMCSQDHVFPSSLTHTLSHFSEVLTTRSPSNSWTLVELHCIVSTLSEHVLLHRIAQSLRFSLR